MKNPGWLNDFVDIIYPNACIGCETPLVTNESCLCVYCLAELPKTNFHTYTDNEVLNIFKGRCKLEKATSYLYYAKGGIVQKSLKALKYRGRQEVGALLGTMAATELMETGFLKDIDVLLPIPLHPKKLARRGFNQSEIVAQAISEVSEIPVSNNNLVRITHSDTQTKKSRFARWLNVESIFSVLDEESFQYKHLLLIDDVVTTGSTVEGSVIKMESIQGIRISLFTVAMAK